MRRAISHKRQITKYQRQTGFIALVTILLITALITVWGLSVALMNLDNLQMSQAWLQNSKAEYQVSACVDNALTVLRNDNTTSGNINLSISNVTCASTISGSGNTRAIVSIATSTDAYGKNIVSKANVNVNINTNPFTIEQYKDILQ